MNKSGKVLFDDFEYFTKVGNKFIFLTDKRRKTKLIDFQGNLLDSNYNYVRSIDENYLIFEQNKKYGVMDTNLNVLIPAISEKDYGILDSQLFLIEKNGKRGLMSINGDQVLPPEYDRINEEKSFLKVAKNNKTAMVSFDGKPITPFIYDNLSQLIIVDKTHFPHGAVSACQNKKCGIIDLNGKEIVPFKYDYLDYFNDNTFEFIKDGKVIIVDWNGKELKNAE